MPTKDIFYSDSARNALFAGVTKLADAVRVTMGPKGRNVVIMRNHGAPHITKDGVTVAKEVTLKNAMENMGAQLVKEVASKTADVAGDGTTTATVLAHAIFKEGLRYVTSGANPLSIKRGMDRATTEIIARLTNSAIQVNGKREIAQVATISANSDTSVGELIAAAMERVGKDGVITVEESKTAVDELCIVEGMQFDRGYLSPYFVTNNEKMIAEITNPYILFCDRKISSMKEMLPLLEKISKHNSPIVIIAEDIEGEALATLVVNKIRGILNVTAVKSPGFGDRRKAMLEDMAILTGGNVVSDELGHKLEMVDIENLGRASKVVVGKDTTIIVGGKGDTALLSSRVSQIKAELEVVTSNYDKEKLQERLAKLTGGIAVIKVGAPTEVEMKEKKDRVDDALAATRAAVEEGIVIGGGAALAKASMHPLTMDYSGDELLGAKIILAAALAPIKQIAVNAGFDGGVVTDTVSKRMDDTYGFDAHTGEYVNMIEAGIIDPTKVVITALSNAVSVAGMLLSVEAGIVDLEQETSPGIGTGMPGMPGMY